MKRLIKKSDRLEVQTGNIDRLLKNGYSLENFEGLKILTKEESKGEKTFFYLTVYRDTAARPIANYYYRSAEAMAQGITRYKESYSINAEYKKTRKKKNLTIENNCAKAIKTELQANFSGVKFSVTNPHHSSVNVIWQDGPTTRQVEDITGKYQQGHFDGMTDMYEYSNQRDDIPQANYVFEKRGMSEETKKIVYDSAAKLYESGVDYSHAGCHDSNDFAYRVFHKCAIPTGAKVLGIIPNGQTCGAAVPEEFYILELDLSACKNIKQTKEVFEPVNVEPGKVHIIDYSEKAIAVIGDTKPIKDKLGRNGLNGKFNARLSCGPGWIFPKSRLEEVRKALKKQDAKEGLRGIEKNVQFFADTDKSIYGYVRPQTELIANVQKVKLLSTHV